MGAVFVQLLSGTLEISFHLVGFPLKLESTNQQDIVSLKEPTQNLILPFGLLSQKGTEPHSCSGSRTELTGRFAGNAPARSGLASLAGLAAALGVGEVRGVYCKPPFEGSKRG